MDTADDLAFGRYLDRTGLDTCNLCGELLPGGEHAEGEGCAEREVEA